MKWTWKHAAAGYTGVGFAVWLIFYIVEWNNRNTAGMGMGDALLNWLGDLVMLHWMKNYQTLVAGVIATAGAAGAILLQREWQIRSETTARRSNLLNVLNWMGSLFTSISVSVARGRNPDALVTLQQAKAHVAALARFSSGMADNLSIALADIEAAIHGDDTNETVTLSGWVEGHLRVELPAAVYAALYSNLLAGFFRDGERLIGSEGEFVFIPQEREVADGYLRGIDGVSPFLFPMIMGLYRR